ncbi:MAG: hypothetical protein GY732_23045 [Gammaproteobacteria bacterium]|nr:hypothetical protein [Gammaproteobacteria bacterium]
MLATTKVMAFVTIALLTGNCQATQEFTPEADFVDGGKSFSWRPLTRNSTADNIRPIIPAWESDQRVVLWMRGTYNWFTDFDTHIVGH